MPDLPDTGAAPEPAGRRRPTWVPVAAVLVLAGMLGGAAAGVVGALRDRDASPSAEAAEALVGAWERRLTGTWVVDGLTERSRLDGTAGELRTPFSAAQRPPERVVKQYGAVDARLDGRSVGCALPTEGGDTLVCADRGPALPYDEQVAAELVRLRALVAGPAPAYTVTETADGCFELRIVKADPAPPLGDRSAFCFDEATGAMRSSEIVSVGVVDRTVATDIRSTVTDADLALPPHEQG